MFKWNEENKIYKEALMLAVPMMIHMGITNAVGLVDNLMIGSLGTESITAVSIALQLIFVYNHFREGTHFIHDGWIRCIFL